MRAEPLDGRAALQLHQIAQPVADRSWMQAAAGLVGEQHRRVGELAAYIVQEPAQHQVQVVEHRHPAGPGPGGAGAFAEADMELAERAPAEVHIGLIQQRAFLRAQTGVIQRSKQRVVPRRGRVLAGGGDPRLEEVEKLRHPLRGRRRQLGRGIIADMAGGVELIDRADQADPERGFDLGRLAGLQESMEPFEDLHVIAAGGGRPAGHRQVPDDSVDAFRSYLPGQTPQGGQGPLQQAGVVVDRHRAEPAGSPRGHEGLDALGLELPRVRSDRLLRDAAALDDL
ncbi:hypothetical protein SAMN05216275_12852 [Streptosporangium canum]|uniref:Uncharacterized protein n=1 Tax=Streptosporangium canum TaxID=324952 RepID=A0A1I4AI66_9ACTN|nr:hypothetical protein SAMN05216275_12852 [Streptosporangium canum]